MYLVLRAGIVPGSGMCSINGREPHISSSFPVKSLLACSTDSFHSLFFDFPKTSLSKGVSSEMP